MLTFDAAEKLIQTPKGRKLDHNTTLVKHDADTYGVRLYGTVILLVHRDGTYTLQAGGYRTVLTKDRLNKFGPVQVYQKNKEWYVNDVPFRDGLKVA